MKKNKKGFTLAELLVVVAIIAVLVAIAIPVFSAATTKAKEAADAANLRGAYAQAVTNQLVDNTPYTATSKPSGLNYSSKATWTGTASKLTVTYDGTKISDLSLTADALS